MTAPKPQVPIVLGLHPTARGFGWAAFTDPFTVHHQGVYCAKKEDNVGCLVKVEWLFKKLQPETVVIEAFDVESSIRSERIRKLCLDIVALAADRNLEFHVYRKGDIRQAFLVAEARTREEIAHAVARHVSALRPYLPDKRKPWVGEDRRLSRLSAAALVLTHYHFEALTFLNDLRDAA